MTSHDDPARSEEQAPQVRTILRPGPVITGTEWPRGAASAHLICIGGAGMSAVARLLLAQDMRVSGSDALEGQFIAPLRDAGATISIGFDAAHLDAPDVVVVSTAVRPDNPEVIAARAAGIPVVHRATALAHVAGSGPLIAVAGTHGKTTTSSMCVLAAHGADRDAGYAIGGVITQYGVNARAGDDDLFILEADESDGSFLAYRPRVLVVTNLEADHLDHYGDLAHIEAAFDAAVRRIEPGGTLVVCADNPGSAALAERSQSARPDLTVVRYGTSEHADAHLSPIATTHEGTRGGLDLPDGRRVALDLQVIGGHNLNNAAAALLALCAVGADPDAAARGIGEFRGAGRRFDVRGRVRGITYVDDYAHHPSEIEATLAAARSIADGHRVLAIFQPHLYSRTRLLARDFADALTAADHVFVLDVYGAREDPEPGVSGALITDSMPAGRGEFVPDRSDVPGLVAAAARPGDVVLALGAGDVIELGSSVLAALAAAPEGA